MRFSALIAILLFGVVSLAPVPAPAVETNCPACLAALGDTAGFSVPLRIGTENLGQNVAAVLQHLPTPRLELDRYRNGFGGLSGSGSWPFFPAEQQVPQPPRIELPYWTPEAGPINHPLAFWNQSWGLEAGAYFYSSAMGLSPALAPGLL